VGPAPALTAQEAREQLGYSVATYLEAGPCLDPVPSTIVDCSGPVPRVLRDGAISFERLREVVPSIEPFEDIQPQLPDMPDPAPVEA
jgi:tRNA A37 threonylcarbamoyladenosine synthetase subunit TsaC/SUA5/YrdC